MMKHLDIDLVEGNDISGLTRNKLQVSSPSHMVHSRPLGRPHCGTTTTKHLGIGATGTVRKMMDRLNPKGLFPISFFMLSHGTQVVLQRIRQIISVAPQQAL